MPKETKRTSKARNIKTSSIMASSSKNHPNLAEVVCTINNKRISVKKRKRRNRLRNKQRPKMKQNRNDSNKLNQSYDDILGNNLDEASYEEIIVEYEKIQKKLQQLNSLDRCVDSETTTTRTNANMISHPRLSRDVDERFQLLQTTSNIDERFCHSLNVNPIDPRFIQPTTTRSNPTLQTTYLGLNSKIIQTVSQTHNYAQDSSSNSNHPVELQSDDDFLSATSESPRAFNPQQTIYEQKSDELFRSTNMEERPYSPSESLRLESPTLTISSSSSSVICCDPEEETSITQEIRNHGSSYDAAYCDMDISDLSDIDTDFDNEINQQELEAPKILNAIENASLEDTNLLGDDSKISPDSPLESDNIQKESSIERHMKIIPESEDEQGVDEAIMRAQLLISEVSRRLSDEKRENEKSSPVIKSLNKPLFSKPLAAKEPFIISVGFSSDEEDLADADNANFQGSQLSVVEKFLKEAREDCDQIKNRDNSNHIIEINRGLGSSAHEIERYKIEQKEHSTSQDILLKRKELKIKLIKAGLLRNNANLSELRMEKIQRREKMLKLKAHALKLRTRYLKAVNIARAAIQDFKIFDEKLINQEKHANAERIQLTKLENDCNLLGKSLVGSVYRLPGSDSDKNRIELTSRLKSAKKLLTARLKEMDKHASPNSPAGDNRVKALSDISSSILQNQGSDLYERIRTARLTLREYIECILEQKVFEPFICSDDRLMYKPMKYIHYLMLPNSSISKTTLPKEISDTVDKRILPLKQQKNTYHSHPKLEAAIYSTNDSFLTSLATSRLELRPRGGHFTSRCHAHNIYPNDYICNADLLGLCQDINCLYQHKSKYLMSDVDKIVDLLSYRPSIAGFKSNPDLTQEENYNACRLKLSQYAKNLLDTNPTKPLELIAENIVKWINCTSNELDLILMTRQLPKSSQRNSPSLSNQKATLLDENILQRLAGRVEFVPYSEYEFNFDFMIQDDSYRLKHSKISKLSEIDPEMSIRFRFFAEGRPISTELETTLESDQHNVQLWLKLAYHNLVRNPTNKAENIDRSLNVLSRALEANPNDPELWETYLILYASRVPRPKESNKMEISNICQLAMRKCSTMSMFRLYLSLTPSVDEKLVAAKSIIFKLISESENHDNIYKKDDLSQSILEVVLFICNLYRHLGQTGKALEIVNKAFAHDEVDETHLSEGENIPNVLKYLHSRDLRFARTCYLYLRIYGRLPETRVEPHGFSLPKVLSTSPFTIFILDIDEVREKLLHILNEDFTDFTMVRLEKYFDQSDCIHESYKNLLLIYYSIESDSTIKDDECFKAYSAAKKQMKAGNLLSCFEHLDSICNKYGSANQENNKTGVDFKKMFEELLCINRNKSDLFEIELNDENSRNRRSIILWLSYILVNKILKTGPKQMNSIYQESINSCSTAMIDQVLDVTILIYDYIRYLVNNTTDLVSFQHTLTIVRHYCVTIAEEDFQIHLIELVLSIVDSDIKTCMNLLFDFCVMLPSNAALINWTLRRALTTNMNEICLKLIDYLLFEKKSHIVHDEWFWISSLSLIIDSGDHLKAHKIFRLAVGNQPYSAKLWKMMLAYEKSINHIEHVDIIESTISHKLHVALDLME